MKKQQCECQLCSPRKNGNPQLDRSGTPGGRVLNDPRTTLVPRLSLQGSQPPLPPPPPTTPLLATQQLKSRAAGRRLPSRGPRLPKAGRMRGTAEPRQGRTCAVARPRPDIFFGGLSNKQKQIFWRREIFEKTVGKVVGQKL